MRIIVKILLLYVLFVLGLLIKNLNEQYNATVLIESPVKNVKGSGIYISYKGSRYILTNHHVCKEFLHYEGDETSLLFKINDKSYQLDNMNDVFLYEPFDICLIKKELFIEPIYLQDKKLISLLIPKFDLHIMLNKNNYVFNVFLGHIYPNEDMYFDNETSFKVIKGDSGSPIFDIYGNLRGIIYKDLGESNSNAKSSAIKINYILFLLNSFDTQLFN